MIGNILWKLILSIIVLAWALSNIFPPKDIPFEDYLRKEVSAEQEVFYALLDNVAAKSKTEKTSFFVALRNLIKERNQVIKNEEEAIDLIRFFPHLNIADIKNREKRNRVLLDYFLEESRSRIKLGLDLNGGVAFTFALNKTDLAENSQEREQQILQAVSVLRDRVDAFGVAEPLVRPKGDNTIEVQLPGLSTRDNPDIIDTLAAPARLKFSEVHRTQSPSSLEERPPPGYIVTVEEYDDDQGQLVQNLLFVKKVSIMDGDIIERAAPRIDNIGRAYVAIDFTSKGTKQFAAQTRRIANENNGNSIGRLAIILDEKLFSAPTVRDAITGGSAVIEGRFSWREATDLANVLNNPLKVGLKPAETYEVSPTLAGESRMASIYAALVGASLVMLFMMAYYRWVGAIAVISLATSLLLVIGVLAGLNASITLAGVAALVLTLGMAVDAQILIFERIREEMNEGKSLTNALVTGYQKAFSTIFDANLTTLITAGVLIVMGTGPVKGFGVTLAIGIGASVFCALIVTRLLLEALIYLCKWEKMPMLQLVKTKTAIPFLNYRRPAFLSAWVVVGIGLIAITTNGGKTLGIDFRGGDEITVNYQQRLIDQSIQNLAEEKVLGEVQVAYMSPLGAERELLKIQTEEGQGKLFFEMLQSRYPEAGLELIGETKIGASVGKQVQRSAIISVGLALLFILLYVGLRFEWGYGFGAVIATIHDMAITIGIYVLLGGQFTAPMVAAILMILGYSINDTIVVFDRIREELKLRPDLSLKGVIHYAITRTLSRTLLTSLTTLLATISLYLFGAGIVVDFALVFLIGILAGTFSSVFIASPIFFWWHKGDRKHVEDRHDILPKYEWDSGSK